MTVSASDEVGYPRCSGSGMKPRKTICRGKVGLCPHCGDYALMAKSGVGLHVDSALSEKWQSRREANVG